MLGQTFSEALCRSFITLGESLSTNNKMFTSGFPEDIARLQKMKKSSLDGSQSVSGANLIHIYNFMGFGFSNFHKTRCKR